MVTSLCGAHCCNYDKILLIICIGQEVFPLNNSQNIFEETSFFLLPEKHLVAHILTWLWLKSISEMENEKKNEFFLLFSYYFHETNKQFG